MARTRLQRKAAAAAALVALVLSGTATATATADDARHHHRPDLTSRLYIASYNGDCTSRLSVVNHRRVVRSWAPVDGPCTVASAMAVRRTIRTLPARPEFVGAEYTLGGVPTGVRYAYPTTVTMDFPDGTTDGRANYAGGYFDGTVYRFTRAWEDPVPLFTTGLFIGGIAYDRDTRSLWVLDSRADFEGGTGEVRQYRRDGTLRSSFVVAGGSTPQPFGLAYDAKDRSLWISRNKGVDTPIELEKYSTKGRLLATVTTRLTGIPSGLEFRLRGCRR